MQGAGGLGNLKEIWGKDFASYQAKGRKSGERILLHIKLRESLMQEERELPRLKKQEKKEEGKMRRKMSNLVLAQFFSLSIKHFTPAVHNSLLVKKKK